MLAGSVVLASRATVDSSYEAYFDPADPAYLAYEQFRDDFGSDEVSYILYEAPGFEHGALEPRGDAPDRAADRGPRGRGALRLRGDEPRERTS